jgi:hypothetical protein
LKAFGTTKVIARVRQTSKKKDWVPLEKMSSRKDPMVIKHLLYLTHSRMERIIIINNGCKGTGEDSH